MTKVVKFWKRFSFWNKVRVTLTAVGVGGEGIMYLIEALPEYKVYAAIATVVSFLITYVFTDNNNNNIVDFLDK